MGIESDYVTFPSMMPLKGKKVSETTKKAIFSYKALSTFFFYVSASYFFEMFMSIRQLGY